jgi:hypothetical protein
MFDKIKDLNPWIIAIILAIGVEVLITLVMSVFDLKTRQFMGGLGFVHALPALKISGYEIAQSIGTFRGDIVDSRAFTETALTTGFSLFIILILGPFLLLKGYIKAERSGQSKKRGWTWYMGAVLIIMVLIPVFFSSTLGTVVHLDAKKSSEKNREKEELQKQAMNLALDASYLLFVPKEEGGGDGSFRTFGNASNSIVLEDLDSFEKDSKYKFELYGEVKDSVITIVGTSMMPGRDENFENITGEIGNQQVSVTVTPYGKNIFKMKQKRHLNN